MFVRLVEDVRFGTASCVWVIFIPVASLHGPFTILHTPVYDVT